MTTPRKPNTRAEDRATLAILNDNGGRLPEHYLLPAVTERMVARGLVRIEAGYVVAVTKPTTTPT